MRLIVTVLFLCIFLPVVLLIAFTPDPCDHVDIVTTYVFAFDERVGNSYIRETCKHCESKTAQDYVFKGELVDKSYLEVLCVHSDGSEIINGEYYTVTASVPHGFVGYGSTDVWLNCRVEDECVILNFTAEFREEFRKNAEVIENGDEIVFRGRFFDEGGFGFTDCELIAKSE